MHEHHHHHNTTVNLKLAFFINLSFAILELIGGILTNSMAVIADAVHDFGDSLSLATALYFENVANRSSDQRYSYGYRRFSLLSAGITAIVIISGSMAVIVESIPRLSNPVEPHAGGMAGLAILGIAVNGYAAWRTSKGRTMNERVISWHMLEDLFGWILILIGAGLIHWLDAPIVDPLMSVGFSAFIVYGVFKNLRKTTQLFLQSVPEGLDRDAVIRDLETVPNVTEIHDLHMWSLDGDSHVISFHAVVEGGISVRETENLKSSLRDKLSVHGKFHATIELESKEEDCGTQNCTPR